MLTTRAGLGARFTKKMSRMAEPSWDVDSATLKAGKVSVAGINKESVRSSVQVIDALRGTNRSTLARFIATGNVMTTSAGPSPSICVDPCWVRVAPFRVSPTEVPAMCLGRDAVGAGSVAVVVGMADDVGAGTAAGVPQPTATTSTRGRICLIRDRRAPGCALDERGSRGQRKPVRRPRPRSWEKAAGSFGGLGGGLRGQLFRPLLDLEERVHRSGAAADQADARFAADPLRAKLVGVFDVIRVTSLHLREIHELARVRRVLPADDDDRVDLLGELARGVLPLHGDRADGVEDLGLLRALGNVRDQVLERPRWLGRLRDDARLLHARELLPLFLRLDDRGRGREAEEPDDLGMLGRPEDDHLVALVRELLGRARRRDE